MTQCFHCSYEFSGKIGRQDTCAKCSSDLHVCRNCKFYDPSSYNECREPSAERVVDKEKRNFCDYFSPSEKARESEKAKTLKALDDLFK
jgi:hypothetical protein